MLILLCFLLSSKASLLNSAEKEEHTSKREHDGPHGFIAVLPVRPKAETDQTMTNVCGRPRWWARHTTAACEKPATTPSRLKRQCGQPLWASHGEVGKAGQEERKIPEIQHGHLGSSC